VPLVVPGGDAVGLMESETCVVEELLRIVGNRIGRNMLVASSSSRSDVMDIIESSRIILNRRSTILRCFDLGLVGSNSEVESSSLSGSGVVRFQAYSPR
jgi:hypothetical protein